MALERPPQPPASLTSDPDRFSDDAWELLLASQDQARRWRHGTMDVEHLLLTLLHEPRFAPWVEPLPLDPGRLLDRLESFCADQPSAPGGSLFIGDALEDLLEAADRRRAAWGSRLLDLPHLLLALVEEPRIGATLLAEEGLSEDLLTRQMRPAESRVAPRPEPPRGEPPRGEPPRAAPPPLTPPPAAGPTRSSSATSPCSTLRIDDCSSLAASRTCSGRTSSLQYTRAVASLRRTSASSCRTVIR